MFRALGIINPPKRFDRKPYPDIRIGIAGLGGFAGSHHHAIARLEDRGVAKLICTCDPHVESFRADLVPTDAGYIGDPSVSPGLIDTSSPNSPQPGSDPIF